MSDFVVRRWQVLLLSILTWLVGSCDLPDRSADGRSVVRERLGDTLLVHSRTPVHTDTARLEEIARIGASEGPEELLLFGVSAFVELPDGRVAVADDSGLRLFSSAGEFLERIARPGQGPGEVEYVVGMDVAADGSLLAADLGNRRINVYRLGTGGLDHWALPPGMPGYGRGSVVATRDGPTYVAYNPPLPQDGSPLRYPRPIFFELDGDGRVIDTVYAGTRFTESCPTRSAFQWRSGFYEDLRAPYLPKIKWALSPTGSVAVGCPADYEVDLLSPDGSVVRLSRDWTPVTVSAEERGSFVEGQILSRNRSGYFERWSWEGERPPDQKPAYQRIVFGREGRIWVWPSQPSVRFEMPEEYRQQGWPPAGYRLASTGAFDVFTETAEYLGAARLPDDLPYSPFPGGADPFIRGDTLWALRYDSLDVPYLAKYAVQWPDIGLDRDGGT
jgi:hypothetical protein